jgi:cbb3-type cytochrome oxidase subunit 3
METLRSLLTVAVFVSFAGIVWWAYAPSRKRHFEEQGNSILERDAG